MPFAIGETIGPYRIIEQLGQGGMATVFKAYHAALDRYVAIKALHPAFTQDPNFLARFQREARVVAKLEHANIVPIYDYSEHQGRPYLVMKFIEGETLKARLSKGRLEQAEIIRIVEAVGAGLAYAHKVGILHRDIKPSNVLLTADRQIYLADFGLARIAAAGESTLSSDMMVGTPQYISPEQAKGSRNLDEGTDIYSFGVLLYELVVGRVPFTADTPYSIIHDHIFSPLPLPRQVNPTVPEAVERVLLKALSKERADRYPTVAALVEAFIDTLRGGQGLMLADMPVPVPELPIPELPSEMPPLYISQLVEDSKAAQQAISAAAVHAAEASQPAAPTVARRLAEEPVLPEAVSEPVPISMPAVEPASAEAAGSMAAVEVIAPQDGSSAVRRAAAQKPAKKRKVWLIAIPIVLVLCICGFLGLQFLGAVDRNQKATQTAAAALVVVEPTATSLPPATPTLNPLEAANQEVALHPDDPWAHYHLAHALLDNGQAEQALREYQVALELAGENFDFYRTVGNELASLGYWLQAAQAYLWLAHVHPQPMPVEDIQRLHETLYKAAVDRSFREAIPFTSIREVDMPIAPVVEARYTFYYGDRQVAIDMLTGFLALPGRQLVEAQLLRAEIAIQLNRQDEARPLLETLIGNPEVPEWVRVEAQVMLDQINTP